MKRWFPYLLCLVGLIGVNPAAADVVPDKVVMHCQDQGNYFSNDPKWLFGERVVGQSFIPSKKRFSFLRAIVYRRTDGGAYTGKANLEIRLWKCKESYAATKNSLPLLSTTDEKKPAFADRFYFPMNVDVDQGEPYYFEWLLKTVTITATNTRVIFIQRENIASTARYGLAVISISPPIIRWN